MAVQLAPEPAFSLLMVLTLARIQQHGWGSSPIPCRSNFPSCVSLASKIGEAISPRKASQQIPILPSTDTHKDVVSKKGHLTASRRSNPGRCFSGPGRTNCSTRTIAPAKIR